MEQLQIETIGESGGFCECCGNETRTIWGCVYKHDVTVAAYFVQWTRNKPDHNSNFDFLIGTWGDETIQDKKLVSWVFNPTKPGGSFMAIDSDSRPAAGSDLCIETLSRDQVIGNSELMATATSLIDAIWLGDPRLEEIKQFTVDA